MAGISPSILQPQPYAGYNPSYAPSGYMPGAPAGFIMNPFVYIPPKPIKDPTDSARVGAQPIPAPSFEPADEPSQEVQSPAAPEESTSNYVFPWQMEEATKAYSNALAQAAEQEQWTGVPVTPTETAPKSITEALPDINYKDVGSVMLSLALGGPLTAAYTAADKFVFNDALPGPLDALNALGNVIGSVGGALGGLFGLNTQPVTTSSSTSTGLSWAPLPPPPFVAPLPPPPVVAAEQYDGYGTTYDQPYTGWQDTTDYGYQTEELTWSPGEDVASWSEDLAQAAEAEQWGG